jgi:rubrerythrin
MGTIEKTVTFYVCERCGHEWYPRGEEKPRVCPKCKSPYWDRARRVPKVAG